MTKQVDRISGKRGLPPGSLVHVGASTERKVEALLTAYGTDTLRSATVFDWDQVKKEWGKEPVRWIEVNAFQDTHWVACAGSEFGLDALALEDVLNTEHRPIFRTTAEGFMFILRRIRIGNASKKLKSDSLVVLVKSDAVVTFADGEVQEFDAFRARLNTPDSTSRSRGAEYLAYRLVDIIVDHYFEVVEQLMEKGERLEDLIFERADDNALAQLQRLRKMHVQLRRSVVPMRECLWGLLKDPPALVEERTLPHWRDVDDHLVQLLDQTDSLRDLHGSLMEVYANVVNRKTNEVMQLMTGIATIFIPLTFIVGIYGMNFDHMPELHWRYGYFLALGGMLLVALAMYWMFRRKRWF